METTVSDVFKTMRYQKAPLMEPFPKVSVFVSVFGRFRVDCWGQAWNLTEYRIQFPLLVWNHASLTFQLIMISVQAWLSSHNIQHNPLIVN